MTGQRIAAQGALDALPGDSRDFKSASGSIIDVDNPLVLDISGRFAREMESFSGAYKFWGYGYELVYGPLLSAKRSDRPRLLEIGLGVNDPSAPSGMPEDYPPCESLRALRSFLPECELHGADIDPRALVESRDWSVHRVNQLDLADMQRLATCLAPLDAVIDDGLHTPEANCSTIAAFFPWLAPGGIIVIEDILPDHVPVWEQLRFQEDIVLQFIRPESLRVDSTIALFWSRNSPPRI